MQHLSMARKAIALKTKDVHTHVMEYYVNSPHARKKATATVLVRQTVAVFSRHYPVKLNVKGTPVDAIQGDSVTMAPRNVHRGRTTATS